MGLESLNEWLRRRMEKKLDDRSSRDIRHTILITYDHEGDESYLAR